jgi:hypothetical protein
LDVIQNKFIIAKCNIFITFAKKINIMGFFQMIKDKLGIGGVSVKLDVPGQAGKADEKLEGKLLLSSKSDQEVVSCTIN